MEQAYRQRPSNGSRFQFLGNPPYIEGDDVIVMVEEIARYDIVTLARVAPKKLAVRIVKPQEYADCPDTMYQVNRGDQIGTFQLREVQMRFWPW
jgi:hypothetical protein